MSVIRRPADLYGSYCIESQYIVASSGRMDIDEGYIPPYRTTQQIQQLSEAEKKAWALLTTELTETQATMLRHGMPVLIKIHEREFVAKPDGNLVAFRSNPFEDDKLDLSTFCVQPVAGEEGYLPVADRLITKIIWYKNHPEEVERIANKGGVRAKT